MHVNVGSEFCSDPECTWHCMPRQHDASSSPSLAASGLGAATLVSFAKAVGPRSPGIATVMRRLCAVPAQVAQRSLRAFKATSGCLSSNRGAPTASCMHCVANTSCSYHTQQVMLY
jgi:hypothetical protein